MKRLIPFAALLCLPLAVVGCAPEDDVDDVDVVDPVAPVDPVDVDVETDGDVVPIESGSSAALGSDYSATLASYEGPVTFSVPDMNCKYACAPKVERTLESIAGISDVETDVETRTVKFNVSKGFDVEAAKKALAASEYPVDNVMM